MSKTFDEIMASWTTAQEFMSCAAFVCDTKAKADKVITHLAASAIKLALDEVAAGRPGTSVEANGLLWYCLRYRKKEAQMLRAYMLNFGPFVAAPDVVTITIDGQKCVLEKGTAVRFNEKKCKDKFSEKTPEEYAKTADAVQFATWKQAMKAESDETKSDGTVKTDAEKLADAKKKLQARIDRAIKDAKEQGITLDLGEQKEPEKIIIREHLDISRLPELIQSIGEDEALTPEVRELLDEMLGLAIRLCGVSAQKKAA